MAKRASGAAMQSGTSVAPLAAELRG